MRTETIGLGAAPACEDCAQTTQADFAQANKAECLAFIQAIKRVCGEPPEGAWLIITTNPHEFQAYREVAVRYDVDDEAAAAYAQMCDERAPVTWEEAGMSAPGKRRNGR